MKQITIIFLTVLLYYQVTALTNDFIMYEIADDFSNGMEIFSIDFDLDGDVDLLTAGNDCTLWLNDGNGNFNQDLNLGNISGARSIRAADLDGDSDNDIVIADIQANNVEILVNEGDHFDQFTLDNNLILPHTIDLKDLDSDGDIDVLCSEFDNSNAMSEIVWWENLGDLNFSDRITITEIFQQSPFVVADFIDSDEHMDIAACGEVNGEVYWWQNDGAEDFGAEIVIDTNINWIHTLAASDLDQDGDKDILGSACVGSWLLWWENDGAGNFSRHDLGGLGGALWMDCADFDLDGDMDLFAVGQGPNHAVLYENDGEQNFDLINLEGDFGDGFSATAADFDNDGDIDLAAIGRSSQQICWWENRHYAPKFSATPLYGNAPLTVNFIDQSNFSDPIEYWFWDFQNNDSFDAFEQFPAYTYEEPGFYSVSLTLLVNGTDQTVVEQDLIQVFSGHTALNFATDESHISFPAENYPEISAAFSLETWINPSDYGPLSFLGLGHIFDKSAIRIFLCEEFPQYPSHSIAVEIEHSDGTVSQSAAIENSIILDSWQHIAVTYDGEETMEIYINGVPLMDFQPVAPTAGIAANSASDFIIGNLSDLTRNFYGRIDEVRIWDEALSAMEIQNNMNSYLQGNEAGLISYWQMNEGTGDTVFDATANQIDGSINAATWCEGIELLPVPAESETVEDHPILELTNYPNPFNPSTTISFRISNEPGFVKTTPGRQNEPDELIELYIYNIKGQVINKFDCQSDIVGGRQSFSWDGTNNNGQSVPSGIYFARLRNGSKAAERKMILLK